MSWIRDRRELSRNGERIAVEPQVFDVLAYLISQSDRVVSKEELLDAVWKRRFVSESALTSRIRSARQAIGDDGRRQTLIRSEHGRGYRFIGQVIPQDPTPATHLGAAGSSAGASLAVLPFETFGAEAVAGLADGLVENLTTVLTRMPLLSIASRQSSFSLRDKNLDARAMGEQLGVRYLVEGSLQPIDDQLRLNAQLIDAKSGYHLWAQQFDRPAVGDAMTRLLRAVLPHLELHLQAAILDDLQAQGRTLGASELVQQATGILVIDGWHRSTFERAAALLRRAIGLEPTFSLAYGQLALVLGLGHRAGLLDRSQEVINETIEHAEQALALGGTDSAVLGYAACALGDVGQRGRAIPLLRKALELNPNNAQAWTALGATLAFGDRDEEALAALTRGIEISPLGKPLGVWRTSLAGVYLRLGRLDDALAAIEEACQCDDKLYLPRVLLTGLHLVRKEERAALGALREALRTKPDLTQYEIDGVLGHKLGAAFTQLRTALEA